MRNSAAENGNSAGTPWQGIRNSAEIHGYYIACNYMYMHMVKNARSQIKSKCYQLALLITVRSMSKVERMLKIR